MAALTWKDVATPNFSPALQGIGQAGNLFSNSIQGLQNALTTLDAQKDADASKNALATALSYGSSGELASALKADPFLGMDGRRVDAATLKAMSGQVDALVNREANLQNMELGKFRMGRETLAANQEDALTSLVPQLAPLESAIYSAKTPAERAAAQAAMNRSIASFGGKIGGKSFLELTGRSAADARDSLGMLNTDQNMQESRQRMSLAAEAANRDRITWNENRDVRSFIEKGISSGIGYAPGTIETYLQSVPDSIRSAVRTGLLEYSKNPSATDSGGSSMSSSGLTIFSGGAQLPTNITTLEGAINYGNNTNVPATRNNKALGLAGSGNGTSAFGPFQINSATWKDFAPGALGKDWKNADPRSMATHMRVGEAIWDKIKNSSYDAVHSRFPSITLEKYSLMKGKNFSDIAPILASGEGGSASSAAVRRYVSDAFDAGIATQGQKLKTAALMGSMSGPSVNPDGSPVTIKQAAERLTGSSGYDKGDSWLPGKSAENAIEYVAAKAGLDYGQAASLIAANFNPSRGIINNRLTASSLDTIIANHKNNNPAGAILQGSQITQLNATGAAYKQAADKAKAAYYSLVDSNNPNPVLVQRALADWNAKEALYTDNRQQVNASLGDQNPVDRTPSPSANKPAAILSSKATPPSNPYKGMSINQMKELFPQKRGESIGAYQVRLGNIQARGA